MQKIGPYLVTRGESIFISLYTLRSLNKTTMRYAHPTLENERKTLEVLAAVFGGGSVEEQITDIEQSSKRAFINLS